MKRSALLLLAVVAVILAACSPADSVELSALSVKSIHPAAGATNVLVDTTVQVEFSGALDTQSLTDAVELVSAAGAVTGTYELDAATNMLAFVPDEKLAYGTQYSVALSDWVRSQSGGTLEQAVLWSFTTEAEPVGGTPGDENPGGEDPEDETPGDEDPEGDLPGSEDPEGDNPGGEDPEGGTPGDEDPEGETPGEEEPAEYVAGDRVPAHLLREWNDKMPSYDETEVVLPGVVTVSPKPWTFADTTTTVEIVFEQEFEESLLLAGVTLEAYEDGRGVARGAGGNQEPTETGTLSVEGNTLTFTFDKELLSGEWYWMYLDIDFEDDDGNHFKGKTKWLFRTL